MIHERPTAKAQSTESPRPSPFGLLDVLKVRLRGPSVRGPRIFSTFDFLVTGFMNNPG
jgi:hypothetical protein